MALYPVSARERDAFGLLKAGASISSAEGGMIVTMEQDGYDLVIEVAGSVAADTKMFGLLDEQIQSTKETMLGKFIPANMVPQIMGPATYLNSGKASVFFESGMFLTDFYTNITDATPLGVALYHNAGVLDGVSGNATRVVLMKVVNDMQDLLATRVTPVPTTGMFAEKAPVLVYQV